MQRIMNVQDPHTPVAAADDNDVHDRTVTRNSTESAPFAPLLTGPVVLLKSWKRYSKIFVYRYPKSLLNTY
jgi:hypothetical protein